MHVNEENRWTRHNYPLQARTKGSKQKQATVANLPPTPPSESEDSTIPGRPKPDAQASNGLGPWYRDIYDTNEKADNPVPQKFKKTVRPKDSVLSLKVPGKWPRDLSPIRAETVEEEHNAPETELPQQDSSYNHPAQSLAEVPLPQHALTPPQSADVEPPKSFKNYSKPLPAQGVKEVPTESSTRQSSWSRKTYPLQISARSSGTAEVQAITQQAADLHQPQVQALAPNESKAPEIQTSWSRKGYPLQSSGVTPIPQSTPIPSPEAEEAHLAAPTPQDGPSADVPKANVWSRKRYPLQATSEASTEQYQPTPPSPPKATTSEDQIQIEHIKATKQETHERRPWSPRRYPLQMSPPTSAPESSPSTATPALPEPESKPSPIYIPKTVRAVKDTKDYDADGRTIVVCLDGTGDKFDSDNSNIVHLVSSLKKDDPSQVTYYQAGIGTYSDSGLSSGFSAAMDMAVGSQLGLHVRDAYHFLMHSYKEGDKICIFGFSRGAYTARCLAGMVHKVGLLPPRNIQQIQFAYEFYANDTPDGWKQSEDFKKTFCIDVNVHFLGCFDSVASVGFIPRQLPLSSTPTSKARYFRHAMALDERRAKFKVCRHQVTGKDLVRRSTASLNGAGRLAQSAHNILPNYKTLDDAPPEYSQLANDHRGNYSDTTDGKYKIVDASEAPFDTDVHEVWFLGAHADVGGGAVKNVERHKLSHIPLRWMIRQCFECNTGILFKTKVLAEHGIDVHTLWPKYQEPAAPVHGVPPSLLERYQEGLPPRSVRVSKLKPSDKREKGEAFYNFHMHEEDKHHPDEQWTPEHVEDFFDAMSPLNDQLIQAPTWWVLEAWPVEYKLFKPHSVQYYSKVGMNMGRYRIVEDVEPNLHWTVRHRMNHMGYEINARTSEHATWRTVV